MTTAYWKEEEEEELEHADAAKEKAKAWRAAHPPGWRRKEKALEERAREEGWSDAQLARAKSDLNKPPEQQAEGTSEWETYQTPSAQMAEDLMEYGLTEEEAEEETQTYEERGQAEFGYEPTYWQDPGNVVRWYNEIKAATPGGGLPDWMTPEMQGYITEAYKFMEFRNNNAPPTDWRYLNAADQGLGLLAALPEPPREGEPTQEQATEANLDAVMAGQAMWMELPEEQRAAILQDPLFDIWQYPPEMRAQLLSDPAFNWDALPAYQQTLFNLQSNPILGGVVQGLLMGGPGGGVIGGVLGWASEKTGYNPNKYFWQQGDDKFTFDMQQVNDVVNGVIGFLNDFGQAVEQTVGYVGQVADAALAELKGIEEAEGATARYLFDPTYRNAAWQAGRIFGETSQLDPWMTNAAILLGLEYDAVMKALGGDLSGFKKGFEGVDWLKNNERMTLGSSEIHTVAENLALEAMQEMRLAIVEEVEAGGDPQTVIDKYIQAYSATIGAPIADLIAQSIADPLDVMVPQAMGKTISTGLKATSGDLVPAFKGGWDRPAKIITEWKALAGQIEATKAAELPAVSRWLAGLNKQGEIMAGALGLYPNETMTRTSPQEGFGGWVKRLVTLAPESRARLAMKMAADQLGALASHLTPDEFHNVFRSLQNMDLEAAKNIAGDVVGSAEFYTIIPMLKGFDVDGLKAGMWDVSAANRGLLLRLADVLGVEAARLVDDLGESKGAQRMFEQLRQVAMRSGDQSAKALLGDMEAGRFTVGDLEQIGKTFNGPDALPWHPAQFQAMVMDAFGSHAEKWGVDYFKITPGSFAAQLAKTLKGVQSVLLLGYSPKYIIDNVINGEVTMAASGVYGLMSMKQIDAWTKRWGFAPERMKDSGLFGHVGLEGKKGSAIADAMRSKGVMGGVQSFTQGVGKFSMMPLAGKMEGMQGARAMTVGMKEMYGKMWERGRGFSKMPPALEKALRGADPLLIEHVYRAIENGVNQKEVMDALGARQRGARALDFVSNAAREMGMERGQAITLLEKAGVMDALDGYLKGADTPEKVDAAFRSVMKRAEEWVDIRKGQELRSKAEHVANALTSEGENRFFEVVLDNFFYRNDMHINHYLTADEVATMVEAMPDEFQGQKSLAWIDWYEKEQRIWRIGNTNVLTNLKGVMQALGLTHPDAQRLLSLMAEEFDTWGKAYDFRLKQSVEHYETWKGKFNLDTIDARMLELEKRGALIDAEFQKAFEIERVKEEQVRDLLVEMVRAKYGERVADVTLRAYQQTIDFRAEMTGVLKKHRKDVKNIYGADRRAANRKFYQDDYLYRVIDMRRVWEEGIGKVQDATRGGGEAGVPARTPPPTPPQPGTFGEGGRVATEPMGQTATVEPVRTRTPESIARAAEKYQKGLDNIYKQGVIQRGANPELDAYLSQLSPEQMLSEYLTPQQIQERMVSAAQGDLTRSPVRPSTTASTPPLRTADSVWKIASENGMSGLDANGNLVFGAKLDVIKFVKKWGGSEGGHIKRFDDITPALMQKAVDAKAAWTRDQMSLMPKVEQSNVEGLKSESEGLAEPSEASVKAGEDALEKAESGRQEAEGAPKVAENPTYKKAVSNHISELEPAAREALQYELSVMRDLVNQGEAGKRIIEGYGKDRTVKATPSTYPSWYGPMKRAKKDVLFALDALTRGLDKPENGLYRSLKAIAADLLSSDGRVLAEKWDWAKAWGYEGEILFKLDREVSRALDDFYRAASEGDVRAMDIHRESLTRALANYPQEAKHSAVQIVDENGKWVDGPETYNQYHERLWNEAEKLYQQGVTEKLNVDAELHIREAEARGEMAMTREVLREQLNETGLPDEQVDVLLEMYDANAKTMGPKYGLTPEAFYNRVYGGITKGGLGELRQVEPINRRMSPDEVNNYARALVRAGEAELRRAVQNEPNPADRVAILDAAHSLDPKMAEEVGKTARLYQKFFNDVGLQEARDGYRGLEKHPEWVENAIARFGLTENVKEAGYILPDGRMLDFSGKREGGRAGYRSYDHRQISEIKVPEINGKSLSPMTLFSQATGSLRFDIRNGDVYVNAFSTVPTPEQVGIITRSLTRGSELFWDVTDTDGRVIVSEQVRSPNAEKVLKLVDTTQRIFEGKESAKKLGAGLYQENKGAVTMLDDMKGLIHAYEAADFSTFVHEPAHIFLRQLMNFENALPEHQKAIAKDWKAVNDWARLEQKGNTWEAVNGEGKHSIRFEDDLYYYRGSSGEEYVFATFEEAQARLTDEMFGRGLEKYVAEGVAPTKALGRVFELAKQWMVEIYRTITGSQMDVNLTPEIRNVFDRLLAEQPLERVSLDERARIKEVEDFTGTDFFQGLKEQARQMKAQREELIAQQKARTPEQLKADAERLRAWEEEARAKAREAMPTAEEDSGPFKLTIDEEFRRQEAADVKGTEFFAKLREDARRIREGRRETLFQVAPPTRSEAFKRWFGDSKVVDENGNPLVVYHGTGAKFEVFDTSRVGQNFPTSEDLVGIFFTSDKGEAVEFADTVTPKGGASNVVEAYVKLEKPVIEYTSGRYKGDPTLYFDNWKETLWAMVIDGRHDGIIVIDKETGKRLVVAVEPTQIKSVNNRGTFEPTNPNILFQKAELPLGGMDQASGFIPEGAILDEAYTSQLKPLLEAMQAEANLTPNPFPAREGGRATPFDNLTPETQAALTAYVKKVTRQEMPAAKLAATRYGEGMRDWALLNYNKKYGFDKALEGLVPYQFWATRTGMNSALRIFDRPAWFANYFRLQRFASRYERDLPDRLKGKIRIELPFLPEWTGRALYVDPYRQLFPWVQFAQPFDQMRRDKNAQVFEAERVLQEWAADGTYGEADVVQAAQGQQGSVWEAALAEAATRRRAEVSNPLDFMSLMLGPAWYLTMPAKALGLELPFVNPQGEGAEHIGLTTMTRTGMAMETATKGTWAEPLGKLAGMLAKPEQWIREKTGLPQFGEYGEYYIDRQLANLVAEGEVTVDEAKRAMIERSGEAYELAVERVKTEIMLRTPTAMSVYAGTHGGVDDLLASLPASVLGGGILPEGELRYRGLKEKWNAAWDAYDKGDTEAIQRFFEDHPEYEVYLMKGQSPDDRLRNMLVSQIWDSYMSLDKATRKVVTAQLGAQFEHAFLNSETRSPESLSVETLARWSMMLGNKPPTPPKEGPGALDVEMPKDVPQLEGLPTGARNALGEYEQAKTQQFPYIYEIQNLYYASSKMDRKRILSIYPQLREYWEWRRGYIAEHPEAAPFLDKDVAEGIISGKLDAWDYGMSQAQAERLIGYYNMEFDTPMFTADYYLKGATQFTLDALSAHQLMGTELTEGAYKELRLIWESYGKPGQSFDDWLENTIYATIGW